MSAEVIDLQSAASNHPIVVHSPLDWRKFFKAFEKHGENVRLRTRCGHEVDLPPDTRPRRIPGGGYYFSCGPNPRYYVACPGCGGGGAA